MKESLWGVEKLVMNLCSKNENVSFLKDEESISITAKLEPNLSHICFHLFTISLAFNKGGFLLRIRITIFESTKSDKVMTHSLNYAYLVITSFLCHRTLIRIL